MMVNVSYKDWPTVFQNKDFSIIITSPCFNDIFTFSSTKFPTASPALTYYVKNAAAVLSWTDADANSTLSLTICGTRTWTVTKTDGSVIDNIFTGVYTAEINSISVQTTLFSKTGTYDMKVKVWYTDLPSVSTT